MCRFSWMLGFAVALSAVAAVAESSSAVAETVDGVMARMMAEKPADELLRFREKDALAFLTADEKNVLCNEYLHFDLNAPAVLTVWLPRSQGDAPVWISEGGYTEAGKQLVMEKLRFDAWEKPVPAGRVNLGYASLDGKDKHYFATLRPQAAGEKLELTELTPRKGSTTGVLEEGARIWSDDMDSKLENIPDELEGQLLVRAPEKRSLETTLVGKWRKTEHPSHDRPDNVVLTWSDNPQTTQTVQWRAAKEIAAGTVQFQKGSGSSIQMLDAAVTVIEDKFLVNDPVEHHFTATMTGLEPDTEYTYRVGNGPSGPWTEWTTFRTAPRHAKPFRFVYMGDAQVGLDDWGRLMERCFTDHPDAQFYIMAGDLINRGNDRDDWDNFFFNVEHVYDRRTLVPCLGNHEYGGGGEGRMYLDFFALPKNGSPEVAPEKSYSFRYGNALFVVLDSNDKIKEQTEWLEEQLANTDAKWKFLIYHHPAYSSVPKRDNPEVRHYWSALCDKYHVDLALQGHDHAYLRTYPMYEEKRVTQAAEGTIYIVSVSGTKYYDQDPRDYTEVGFVKTNTFQVLDIQLEENKLTYNAIDEHGEVKDTFVIEK